jgi:hypothetical protein
MQEQILETVRGLLEYNFPAVSGAPTIYDRTVAQWYIGETALTGKSPLPAIVVKSAEADPKDDTFGTQVIDHKITIEVWDQGTTREKSERNVNEGARLIRGVIRQLRRIWVMYPCPICSVGGEQFQCLSPTHYSTAHTALLQPYMDAAVADYVATYNLTHETTINSSQAYATLPASGVANEAVSRLFADISAASTNTIANLTNEQFANCKWMLSNFAQPTRLLYDCQVSGVTVKAGEALLFSAEISFTAKEQDRLPSFGPDGALVPTVSEQVIP